MTRPQVKFSLITPREHTIERAHFYAATLTVWRPQHVHCRCTRCRLVWWLRAAGIACLAFAAGVVMG